jgi:hypothetical protein
MTPFVNTVNLDQLLLRHFGGKVGRGLGAECQRHHELSNR